MPDGDDGSEGKRKGIARAYRHANPEWVVFMLEAVRQIAMRKPIFMGDDVEAYRLLHRPDLTTHEKRAMGGVMGQAVRLGYCVKTPDWQESRQRVNHRRSMRVWYSLIYRGNRQVRMPKRRALDPRQFDFDL